MVDGRVKAALIYAAYEVIAQEQLPMPDVIRFRDSKIGNRRRMGVCKQRGTKYSIVIATHMSKFVEDESGRYSDRNGKHYSRAPVAVPAIELLDTLAHEVAHLKYWTHSPSHAAYRGKIFELLTNRLSTLGIKLSG